MCTGRLSRVMPASRRGAAPERSLLRQQPPRLCCGHGQIESQAHMDRASGESCIKATPRGAAPRHGLHRDGSGPPGGRERTAASCAPGFVAVPQNGTIGKKTRRPDEALFRPPRIGHPASPAGGVLGNTWGSSDHRVPQTPALWMDPLTDLPVWPELVPISTAGLRNIGGRTVRRPGPPQARAPPEDALPDHPAGRSRSVFLDWNVEKLRSASDDRPSLRAAAQPGPCLYLHRRLMARPRLRMGT